jgi:hypothetical protein
MRERKRERERERENLSGKDNTSKTEEVKTTKSLWVHWSFLVTSL